MTQTDPPSRPARSEARPRTVHSVTARSAVIGFALLPLVVYCTVHMELVRGGIWPTVMTLLFTAVSTLFVLVLLNMAARQRFPGRELGRGELLTIYTILSVGSALAGTDVLQTLICVMGRATYMATPENGWAEKIVPLLPSWLAVKDKELLKGFYEGSASLLTPGVLAAWVRPLGAWMLFIAAALTAMFSLNVLARRQWVDAERLNYPIITLPIELTRMDPPFLAQPMLWLGFAVAGGIDLLNGIHHLYPAAPEINCKILMSLGDVLVSPPWNGVGWMPITLYPFAIGLGFLIPLDLVFSCWFFYLVWKAERVFVVAYALDPTCMRASFDGPYSTEQVAGVWMATLAFALWAGRHHGRLLWRQALGREPEAPGEAMGMRTAMALTLASASAMVLFCWAAGMAPWVAAFFVAFYLALSFYLARVRAELGPPAHDMYGSGPDMLLSYTVGGGALPPSTRGAITMFVWVNRESCRSHPMPAQAEALKAASVVGMEQRRLWPLLLAAALLGAACAMVSVLHLGYTLGSPRLMGPSPSFAHEALLRLQTWNGSPAPPVAAQRWAMGAGAGLALTLLSARARWFWFPLHPVGYAVSGWWAINLFWFPLLIATVLKGAILRWGGLRIYRRTLPFFMGLILGEFVVGAGWQVAGALLNMNTYAFWI